jgi:methionine biosynthesis protein MetW
VATTGGKRASEQVARPQPRAADSAAKGAESPDFKYTRFDDAAGSTHNLVVDLVPEGSSVLEVGCATGYMSRVLAERRGCQVTGIEIDAEAAAEANAYCDRVIVGDVETLDLDEHLGDERYDAVLFADVLEHLRDPAAVLRRMRPFVAEGGAVIASIPNVAHISVRLALLGGEFRYRELGLLDDTHLRFFTRASIVDLFESAGFVVSTWHRRRIDPSDAEITPPSDVPEGLSSWLGSDPELTTYQFVVRAVPSEVGAQLADLRSRLREAEDTVSRLAEHEGARDELEALRAELDDDRSELELLRTANEAQARHRVAERLALADQMEQEVAAERAAVAAVQEEVKTLQEEIKNLREEIMWRTGVMEHQEDQLAKQKEQLANQLANHKKQLEMIENSRSMRYTEPLRRLAAVVRRR